MTFDSLERAGLLLTKTSTGRSSYSSLRKALRLIVDEVDEQKHVIIAAQANDSSQGRISNTLAALPNAIGWRGFEEPLRLVKGQTFDEIQKQEDKAIRAKRNSQSEILLKGRIVEWS